MINILYAVYHELKWEMRSKEVLQALQLIGKVTVITIDDIPEECKNENTQIIVCKGINGIPGSRYLNFHYEIYKNIRKGLFNSILLHDMPHPIRYVKKNYPNMKVLYDQSELVINRKVKNIKSLLLSLFDKIEKRNLYKLDLYISACQERAEIAISYFKLNKSNVIVFDNIHKIQDLYTDENVCKKYNCLFNKDTFNVLYGGGIRYDRGTYELAYAFKQLGSKYRLILAGKPWDGEDKFNNFLKQQKIDNVNFIGFVSRDDWGYLLKRCHATVVYFLQNTINNKYCASGKMYESLFMHKPIICSSNPPLANLCAKYNCGASGDNLVEIIRNVRENYEEYVLGTEKFENEIDYEARITTLANQIKTYILK